MAPPSRGMLGIYQWEGEYDAFGWDAVAELPEPWKRRLVAREQRQAPARTGQATAP